MTLLATDKSPLFEKEINLWAYPVESIFAEKLETAIARAEQNSRMKDYHDLLLLVRGNVIDKSKVKTAISVTFQNRGTAIQKLSILEDQMESIQKHWSNYLRSLSSEVREKLGINIQNIMDEINNFLEKINI